jgi:lipid II:glycine glycyltransferase (peptidoglycan interpeptide bridge formation enzyme)
LTSYKIINNPSREEWTSFIDQFGVGNLQQSFEYGEIEKEAIPHSHTLRLMAIEENTPVGLVQATYQKRLGFGYLAKVGGTYGNGPVIGDVADKSSVLRDLLDTLRGQAVKNRVSEASIHWPESWGMHEIFDKMGYECVERFNVYKVHLKKTVEECWNSISHNKRRNIKKAEAQNVKVTHSPSFEDFNSFYEMLSLSGKRAGFTPPPFSLLQGYLKTFESIKKAMVFLAGLNDQSIAGVFVIVHGDTAYALGAGSREETWNARPNDILHWEAIKWACNQGLSKYHMGHVSDPPPTEGSSHWGLWRWKREWNGQLEKTLVYHRIYMPKIRKFIIAPYEKISRGM